MNFIMRNLGWLLLIVFFISMLYLISTQNNTDKGINPNHGTGIILGTSGSIDMMKENSIKEDDKNKDESVVTLVKNNSHTLNKKTLSKEIDTLKKEMEDNTTDESENNESIGIMQSIRNFFTINSTGSIESGIIKHTPSEKGVVDIELINSVDSELEKTITQNKTNLETKDVVLKKPTWVDVDTSLPLHTLAVHSLKINDAWFTKKLGIINKGDTIQQLTNTNKYGCFKGKIISSNTSKGLIGWMCEKYMTESTYKKQTGYSKGMKLQIAQSTKIGTHYVVNTHALKLNNKLFNITKGYIGKGDTLKQLSKVNTYGCFKSEVLSTKSTLKNTIGLTGWVCQRYVVTIQ